MKLIRLMAVATFVAAIVFAAANFASVAGPGQVETNPPGWPSCCGVEY
ncbi:hypothetical protein [Micromonospora sp. NBC_01813]|nr:hypothetical protein [Micromonospora sp. NBC_01813]WSA10866.1 hypothetical protein OG958_08870 [Micromonospora sp. NBC_01813]